MLYVSLSVLVVSVINAYKASFKGFLITVLPSLFIITTICVSAAYYSWFHDLTVFINFGTLFNVSPTYSVSLTFYIDFISINFAALIFFITFVTILYVVNYFKHEPELTKLMYLLLLFSLSMVGVVLASNSVLFFFFWEMIGISSFLLINFFHLRISVNFSAYKAFIFNKISDGFVLFYIIYKETSFIDDITLYTGDFYVDKPVVGVLCLVIAGSCKSAQLGLHVWLPESMEAPVPASALIHSATLVSAGVYLLLRIHDALVMQTYLLSFLYLWYSLTALYGGFVAAYQVDLKKLLAYSTISHCGFLCISALSGNIHATIIYLFLHGFFKAASFMLVGFFINCFCTQDLRYISQPQNLMPIETALFIGSLINLAALPGSIGFAFKSIFIYNISWKSLNIFIIFLNMMACLSGLSYVIQVVSFLFVPFYRQLNYDIFYRKVSYTWVSLFVYFIYLFFLVFFFFFFLSSNTMMFVFLAKINKMWVIKLFYVLCGALLVNESLVSGGGNINFTAWYFSMLFLVFLLFFT